MTNMNNYCVIMGGGIGSRFWPFSRKTLPKQFLDFFGTGRSLLQQTFDRFQTVDYGKFSFRKYYHIIFAVIDKRMAFQSDIAILISFR